MTTSFARGLTLQEAFEVYGEDYPALFASEVIGTVRDMLRFIETDELPMPEEPVSNKVRQLLFRERIRSLRKDTAWHAQFLAFVSDHSAEAEN